MNKIIFFLSILLILSILTYPKSYGLDIKENYLPEISSFSANVGIYSGDKVHCTSFNSTDSFNIAQVQVPLKRNSGAIGAFEVRLYNSTTANVPDTKLATVGYVDGGNITLTSSFVYYNITFQNVAYNALDEYFICLFNAGSDPNYLHAYENASNPYSRGGNSYDPQDDESFLSTNYATRDSPFAVYAADAGSPSQPVLTLNTSLVNNTYNYNQNAIKLNWSGAVTEGGYDIMNCSVHDGYSYFNLTKDVNITKGLQVYYNLASTTEEFYWKINCSNGVGINDTDGAYTYWVDTVKPTVQILYPDESDYVNETYFNVDDTLILLLTGFDYNLYAWNFTIKNKAGAVLYNLFEIKNDSTSFENLTGYLMDTELYNATMELKIWDSHTNNKVKPLEFMYQDEMILAEDLVIQSQGMKMYDGQGKPSTYFYEDEDRYKFKVTWNDQAYQHTFILSATSLDYIENSEYKGHFVWKMQRWVDFEGDNVKSVEVFKISENMYEVTVYHDTSTDEVEFESIGDLNVNSIGYVFNVQDLQTVKLISIDAHLENIEGDISMIWFVILYGIITATGIFLLIKLSSIVGYLILLSSLGLDFILLGKIHEIFFTTETGFTGLMVSVGLLFFLFMWLVAKIGSIFILPVAKVRR